VVAIFSTRLLSGTALTIFGDGEQTRDYVFVGDVVSANMTVSEVPVPDAPEMDAVAFNVGTGQATSVNQLAHTLERVSGLRPGRSHEAPRPGELLHSCLDTGRLQALGWSCSWTLETGLRETFQHIAKESETV
jgi:UDP-glucose 4-epimerase